MMPDVLHYGDLLGGSLGRAIFFLLLFYVRCGWREGHSQNKPRGKNEGFCAGAPSSCRRIEPQVRQRNPPSLPPGWRSRT